LEDVELLKSGGLVIYTSNVLVILLFAWLIVVWVQNGHLGHSNNVPMFFVVTCSIHEVPPEDGRIKIM
jgi:hypothetical protein